MSKQTIIGHIDPSGKRISTDKGCEADIDKRFIKSLVIGDVLKVKLSSRTSQLYRAVSLYWRDKEYKALLTSIGMADVTPLPNAEVVKASKKEIAEVFGLDIENYITIGTMRNHKDININYQLAETLPMTILGMTGRGKSQTAMVIIEELMAQGKNILVVDPHGDYSELKRLYPGAVELIRPKECDEALDFKLCDYLGKLAIINLTQFYDEEDKTYYVELLFSEILAKAKRGKVHEVFIFLDEAHQFAPQGAKEPCKVKVINLAKEGRKFGVSVCIISQRPASVDKNALSQCHLKVIHGFTEGNDLKAILASVEGVSRQDVKYIQKLRKGEALVVGANIQEPIYTNIRWRDNGDNGQKTKTV